MTQNILLMLAHSVEERDQLELLSSLGFDVFSLGAYETPEAPGDDIRPPLYDVPRHPELHAAAHEHRARMERDHGPPGERVDWAKYLIPPAILDWADIIICHHIEWQWLLPQWNLIRDKRVIWRTVGQSVEHNERRMAPLREDGLQVVRYSPREANIPGHIGADALIRFWHDPEEWSAWSGLGDFVVNVTQGLKRRDPWTNYGFWQQATEGLPTLPIGEGSEEIGGLGRVPYDEIKHWLRNGRCYLYTCTQPASYTLGLIGAMMTGIPLVAIGPEWMKAFPYGPALYEAHELASLDGIPMWTDDPLEAKRMLRFLLDHHADAAEIGLAQRDKAISLFGRQTIGEQWRRFLT